MGGRRRPRGRRALPCARSSADVRAVRCHVGVQAPCARAPPRQGRRPGRLRPHQARTRRALGSRPARRVRRVAEPRRIPVRARRRPAPRGRRGSHARRVRASDVPGGGRLLDRPVLPARAHVRGVRASGDDVVLDVRHAHLRVLHAQTPLEGIRWPPLAPHQQTGAHARAARQEADGAEAHRGRRPRPPRGPQPPLGCAAHGRARIQGRRLRSAGGGGAGKGLEAYDLRLAKLVMWCQTARFVHVAVHVPTGYADVSMHFECTAGGRLLLQPDKSPPVIQRTLDGRIAVDAPIQTRRAQDNRCAPTPPSPPSPSLPLYRSFPPFERAPAFTKQARLTSFLPIAWDAYGWLVGASGCAAAGPS